jgi:hypothetical protein
MNKTWTINITFSAPALVALAIVLVGLLAFNNTPTVRADGPNPNATDDPNLAAVPPINPTMNAKYVDNLQAAKKPAANKLLALNAGKMFPLSVIPQGPGSGLNADTLDSLDSSAFALAGHNHFGQTWTGAAAANVGLEVYNTSTSGATQGLFGRASSSDGGGVLGVADSTSGTAYGVVGFSHSPVGAGVEAIGAGTSGAAALEIREGGIRVTSAGKDTDTPAFIHVATNSNIFISSTTIDNPMTNGNPNAILIVVPNWNPGGGSVGVNDNHPIGVWYDGTHWQIFNQDSQAMPVGAAFNVLVITP